MLNNDVKVSSRFQRSIRIDADISNSEIIESFVCPKSSSDILTGMAESYKKGSEHAFTWTGPYGSGKSSLVVAFSAILTNNPKTKKAVEASFNKEDLALIKKGFNIQKNNSWLTIPVVGHRGSAENVIVQALEDETNIKRKTAKESAVSYIKRVSEKQSSRIFIFIDEMGKFLEASADGAFDVYFFQELAELASRSKGKIVIVGILHQAFSEYARRLSKDARDEWSKIQGRYVDMPLNVAGEELIDIISRAIVSDIKPKKISPIALSISKSIANWRPINTNVLAKSLTNCWPLHPATAALLGPVSRRRFGQNQRSVFGFLNSAEPNAFQHFLKTTAFSSKDLFTLPMLWDYLRSNLEPSIMASPDGHRWSLALESLMRAEASGADHLTLNTIKCIAMMDMFQERSGLVPDKKLLLSCIPEATEKDLNKILKTLESWSIVIFKKHKKSYSLYEGSDFDIDASIEAANEQIQELDFNLLKKSAVFQPIVAKKHYHETGALRWMNVDIVPVSQAMETAASFKPKDGSIGLFLVILGTETSHMMTKISKKVANSEYEWPIIVSAAKNSEVIISYAKEAQALEWIKSNNPALGGDTVARREVDTRLATIKNRLEECLIETLSASKWHTGNDNTQNLNFEELSSFCSLKANDLFKLSPKINSELVNRIKPSSNSNGALKNLLLSMVTNEGEERLGIEGFPAEGGLYETLIFNSNLYTNNKFKEPTPAKDLSRLLPLWKETDKYFKNKDKPVNLVELYSIWKSPPFGIKDGLLPFLSVAYIMTRFDKYAVYLEGVYRPSIDSLFVDYLMKSPKDIALRQMNFSDIGQKILAGVSRILNEISPNKGLLTETSKPLDIARRLVSTVIDLPPWVLRTRQLSKNTILVRELIKNANDPNKVLFDDLPYVFKEYQEDLDKGNVQPIISEIENSLKELVNAYPKLLNELNKVLFDELQIDGKEDKKLLELSSRAKNIMHISGDFKLDAFAARLTNYKSTKPDIEGIASLAADKPSRDWIDLDVNRAKLRIAELANEFNHVETYGRVQNREDNRQAVAFMVGLNGKPKTYVHEFSVKKAEQKTISDIENIIKKSLNANTKKNSDLLLAALANIGAEILEKKIPANDKSKKATA